MKIHICIVSAIITTIIALSGCQSYKEKKAYKQFMAQIDSSMTMTPYMLKYATGSATIDSLSFSHPMRIRYVYNDVNNSGFSVYKEKNGKLEQVPFIIETSSAEKTIYITERWENVTLKIVTSGSWAISMEEFGANFKPVTQDYTVDSLTYRVVLDSLLNIQANLYHASDTSETYQDLIPLTKYWRTIEHRSGHGLYESDWFYLPKCTVRIQSYFDPIPYSDGCDISLEGKGKKDSWNGLAVGMYDWKRISEGDKTYNIPAGNYFIHADGDGYWEYRISVCY